MEFNSGAEIDQRLHGDGRPSRPVSHYVAPLKRNQCKKSIPHAPRAAATGLRVLPVARFMFIAQTVGLHHSDIVSEA
jgi:hypothetical protein